jgi:hypothetical protein
MDGHAIFAALSTPIESMQKSTKKPEARTQFVILLTGI